MIPEPKMTKKQLKIANDSPEIKWLPDITHSARTWRYYSPLNEEGFQYFHLFPNGAIAYYDLDHGSKRDGKIVSIEKMNQMRKLKNFQ